MWAVLSIRVPFLGLIIKCAVKKIGDRGTQKGDPNLENYPYDLMYIASVRLWQMMWALVKEVHLSLSCHNQEPSLEKIKVGFKNWVLSKEGRQTYHNQETVFLLHF